MNYILFNAKIFGYPAANAILVVNDSIFHIGTEAECRQLAGAQFEAIDIKSKLILPAFTDAHSHFVELSKARIQVDLLACRSIEDIRTELVRYRDALSWSAQWILGGGWNRNVLSHPLALNKAILDQIFPDIPVALFSRDYHAKLLNSKALSIAGWDRHTPDPAGGKFERLPDGELSGVLFETATEMIDHFTKAPDAKAIVNSIKETVNSIYELGLIGFHSMESYESAELLRQAQDQGSLFRVCWHFQANELDMMIASEKKSYEGDELFKIGGLKLFGDGSLGSRTAAMFDPYPGEANNRGILRYEDEELYSQMQKAAQAGLASTIHAIGDRCVRQVIDATLRLRDNPEFRNLFHRIEHVQSIRLRDIADLKRSGLFASLQPVHIANDIPMIHANWEHISDEAYAFRTMLQAGIPYAFGSDAPIETINPFHGIYSALQRRHKLDPEAESHNPDESITVEQAIYGYSLGAAAASCSEQIRGKLAKGFLADLIVIEDYRALPDEYWLQARSLFTMIGGHVVLNSL
jgi:predicted amidohydrolase YtcJ